ncbi:MAG: hypothetical protein ACLQOO_29235 [Terriglobia bacterium]
MPIEVGHGFEAAEAGLSQAAFQAAASQMSSFRASDFFQQLVRAPALGRGAGQEIIQPLGGDPQAQTLQLRGQIIVRALFRGLGQVHHKPPVKDRRRSGSPGQDDAKG